MKEQNFIETPRLTERFEHAFVYALHRHAHQLRKGGSLPYRSHLQPFSFA
jgi:hypothetical protein